MKRYALWFGGLALALAAANYLLPEPAIEVRPIPKGPQIEDDLARIDALGDAAVQGGLATAYEVSGWNGTLDLTISSLLSGDARTLADGVCGAGGDKAWARRWTVRVFLPTGDRPAAICPL